MFETGIPFSNLALFLLIAYVIWGGWVITGLGIATSLRVMRAPGSGQTGADLLATCLAPFTHIAIWAALAPLAGGDGDVGILGLSALIVLQWALVLVGPVMALRAADRLGLRVGRPGSVRAWIITRNTAILRRLRRWMA